MVILSIDDHIASSILLLLTPNIKDCRYDHVIDSSTIIDRHVLLSHHENILLADVLPISITNYVINRKTIHMMICYYHRNVNMDQYLSKLCCWVDCGKIAAAAVAVNTSVGVGDSGAPTAPFDSA
eukprot:scaffold12211_cov165-Skeletonema_marinoi.AAC.3